MNLQLYNIKLIDITDLLVNTVLVEYIDYIHTNNMSKLSKSKRIKVYYHFFIKNICDLLTIPGDPCKKILFLTLDKDNMHDTVLINRLSHADFDKNMFIDVQLELIKRVERNFPIKFHISPISYDNFMKNMQNITGDSINMVNFLRSKTEKTDYTKFTYNKILKFTKKFELQWLTENYFNDFKSKLLLVS
jgi:hypothetical protein